MSGITHLSSCASSKMNKSTPLHTWKQGKKKNCGLSYLLIITPRLSPVRLRPSSLRKRCIALKNLDCSCCCCSVGVCRCLPANAVNKINPFAFTLPATQVILIQGGRRLPCKAWLFIYFSFIYIFIYFSFPLVPDSLPLLSAGLKWKGR